MNTSDDLRIIAGFNRDIAEEDKGTLSASESEVLATNLKNMSIADLRATVEAMNIRYNYWVNTVQSMSICKQCTEEQMEQAKDARARWRTAYNMAEKEMALRLRNLLNKIV